MIQNKKRIISLILMLTLLVSALVVGAVTASAADETATYEKVTVAPDDWSGEYLIVYEGGKLVFDGSRSTLDAVSNTQEVTIADNQITTNKSYAFTIEKNGNNYVIKSSSGYYIGNTSNSKNQLLSNKTTKYDHKITMNGTNVHIASVNGPILRYNKNSDQLRFRYFKSGSYSSQQAIQLYKLVESTSGGENTCDHSNATITTVEATCTLGGSVTTTCDCGYTNTTTSPALGHTGGSATCEKLAICTRCSEEYGKLASHTYEGGVCTSCGEKQPLEATITFDSKDDKRIEYSTSKQVWTENGITITNTGSVGDYFNPVRFYKSSKLVVESSDMVKIVFACNTNDYATSLKNSIGDSATLNGKEVTVIFAAATNSFEIALTDGQVRVDSITVFAADPEQSVCTHKDTYENVTTPATCTTTGTKEIICNDCGEKIGEEEISVTKHTYVNNICSVCGKVDPLSVDYSGRFFIAAIRTSGNYFYMTSDLGTATTSRYQIVDSGLTELTETVCPKDGFIFVLVKNEHGTYKIYAEGVEGDNYLGWTSGNSGTLVAEVDAICFTVDLLESGLYNIHFAESEAERYLALNGTSGNDYFAFYKSGQKQDLSLIPVSDHVYADATCTAPKTCACGATEGEALGHNHENCPHKAVVGETYYETLQQAIAGAAAGSEIVLNSDIEVVGDLTIENQVTINLNGKTLTAGAVVTFFEGTQFIGEGKLEVAKDSLYSIKGETDYVPVWNEAGYYTFSEVKDQIKESTVEDTEVVVFRPAFENKDIKKEFADGATDNGISFVISITWGTGENAVSKEYTLSEELIANVYNAENPKAIQLGFENWQAGVEYTVTLRIVSGGLYYETTLCTMKDGAITVPEIVTE